MLELLTIAVEAKAISCPRVERHRPLVQSSTALSFLSMLDGDRSRAGDRSRTGDAAGVSGANRVRQALVHKPGSNDRRRYPTCHPRRPVGQNQSLRAGTAPTSLLVLGSGLGDPVYIRQGDRAQVELCRQGVDTEACWECCLPKFCWRQRECRDRDIPRACSNPKGASCLCQM